jgi:hypothetical protein
MLFTDFLWFMQFLRDEKWAFLNTYWVFPCVNESSMRQMLRKNTVGRQQPAGRFCCSRLNIKKQITVSGTLYNTIVILTEATGTVGSTAFQIFEFLY